MGLHDDVITYNGYAYVRIYGQEVSDKYEELNKILKAFTGDASPLKFTAIVGNKLNSGNDHVCICSKTNCKHLYELEHNETGVKFGLGSKCIEKYFDDTFPSRLGCYNRNGKCQKCGEVLVSRTCEHLEKNYSKKNNGVCFQCVKKKEELPKKFLDIPYSEKDHLKKLYGIEWDEDIRKWYIVGDIPKELKQYCRRYLSIPYSEKDRLKSKFNIKWDMERKKWYILGKVPSGLRFYYP